METAQLSFAREGGWSSPWPALDSPSTLVLAFGVRELLDDPAPLLELSAAFPLSTVIGCSSAGQLVGARVSDRPLDVTIVRFAATTLSTAHAAIGPEGSRAAGATVGRSLVGARAVLAFCDGMQGNGTGLAEGLAETLPGVAIGGALAADGSRFERTWVLHEGRPREGLVVAVGLSGPRLETACASAGGWVAFGAERRVTRSEGSVLYELGGEPALDVYRTYLGELAQEMPASGLLFPLMVRRDRDDEHPLVRTIVGVDEQEGSLRFAGDIPEGHRARLMTGSPDRLLDGTYGAASAIGRRADGQAPLVLAVSCIGRRLVYGPRVPEEAEVAMAELTPESVQCGLFSYGELGPSADAGCALFNQTFTATALWERAA